MVSYLTPIEQLFELNRELIPLLDKFEHEYPKEWQCPSNPKLRILNPISCLKSRLSNISAKIKDIQTEKELWQLVLWLDLNDEGKVMQKLNK